MAVIPVTPENFTLGHVFVIGLNLIKAIAGFSAMVAVVAIIWGGFLILSSGGNEEKAKNGKMVVTFAILGVTVIVLARVIVAQALRVMAANCPYDNAAEITQITDPEIRKATAASALDNPSCFAKFGSQLNNL